MERNVSRVSSAYFVWLLITKPPPNQTDATCFISADITIRHFSDKTQILQACAAVV